jgi:menaquinone-dependent protoporphyrinogen IX oxidase
LIVYGTRYGAAASTSEEIAKKLIKEGIEVRVVNAKEEKVKNIAQYDLVIVGSGIQIHRWTSEPEQFLRKFRKELTGKKLALFVCCGSASQALSEEKPDMAEKARKRYLEEKAAKYSLQPIALGLFGGVYNYNKEPWYAKKAMEADRPRIESAYKETQPGIYDTRDWNAIRVWAEELAKKLRCSEKLVDSSGGYA